MTKTQFLKTTIPIGTALSGEIAVQGDDPISHGKSNQNAYIFGFELPSAWTAASLTFQVKTESGEGWKDLNTKDAEYTATTADADAYIAVDPAFFAAIKYIRIRSGTKATPVNQVAERTIHITVRNV